MKTITNLLCTAFFATLFLCSGCVKDDCERELTYIEYTPVWIHPTGFRSDIQSEAPRELKRPGKIYFYNNYIFINEQREGIHIIDNSIPESPQRVSFIPIEGNIDMAIKGDILYADHFIDLLALDIKDPLNARLLNRSENVFPHQGLDENGFLLSHYEFNEKTEVLNCQETSRFVNRGGFWFQDFATAEVFSASSQRFDSNISFDAGSNATSIGTGGSLARFTIVNDYLYTIDDNNLHVFDLNDPIAPNEVNLVGIAWGIETIFPHEDKLFIAGNDGLYIYDNSNPVEPTYLSQFNHARACDPVYIKDNYAYVTLRDGTECEGFLNQLDLIDITDIENPRLERTFPMENPHGLGIKDNTLFLCEGEGGIKVFDIEIPEALDQNQLDRIKDIHAFDVIPVPSDRDLLLVIGEGGFYQYDSENPDDLKLISSILVEK